MSEAELVGGPFADLACSLASLAYVRVIITYPISDRII